MDEHLFRDWHIHPVACCACRNITCPTFHTLARTSRDQDTRMENAGTLRLEVHEEQCRKGEAFPWPWTMWIAPCLPCIPTTKKSVTAHWSNSSVGVLHTRPNIYTDQTVSPCQCGSESYSAWEGSSNRTWLLQMHLISWPCFYRTLSSD